MHACSLWNDQIVRDECVCNIAMVSDCLQVGLQMYTDACAVFTTWMLPDLTFGSDLLDLFTCSPLAVICSISLLAHLWQWSAPSLYLLSLKHACEARTDVVISWPTSYEYSMGMRLRLRPKVVPAGSLCATVIFRPFALCVPSDDWKAWCDAWDFCFYA